MSTLDKNYGTGGKRRRRMKKFRLNEISLVDQPAHTPARVAIMKRKGDAGEDVIQKQIKMAVTSMGDGHAHTLVLVEANSEGMSEKRAGQTSFADGHVHDWIMDDAGNIIIAENMGHSHAIVVQVTKNADSEDEIDPAAVLAAAGVDQQASEETTAEDGDHQDTGDTMSDQNDRTADDNAKAVTQEQHDEVLAKANRLEAIVKLSPEQRAHFDALPTSEQDDFLNAEDRDAIVKNAKDADPIVFEDPDAGIVLRKSADPTTLALAKSAKESRDELAKERALRKRDELRKRAGDLLKNCKGDDDVKAAVLGAVEGITDETLRKGALELLKAKDAGLGAAFEEFGTTDDNEGAGSEPEQRLEKIAKGLRDANPNLSQEQAYSQALDTPEGRALHAQMRS